MAGVDPVEALGQMVAAGGEIKWRTHGGDTGNPFAGRSTLFAGPFEKGVAAKRYAGCVELAAAVGGMQAAQYPVDLFGIAGMVGAWALIQFSRTAAKVRQGEAPAGGFAGVGGRDGVVALRTAFESVEEDEQRCVSGAVEEIDVDEVTIGRRPAFAAQLERLRLDEQRPEGLRLAAG